MTVIMALLLTQTAVFVLLCNWLTNTVEGQQKIPAIKALSDDLLKNYSKHILPVETEPMNVIIAVNLLALGEIDEVEEKMSSVFWVSFRWTDASLKWNNTQTGIDWITLGYSDVWKPVIRVTNPHADISKSQSLDRSNDFVACNSDGLAFYDEMMTTQTTCDLDMTYYPFDVQSCSIELMIAGSTIFWFELELNVYSQSSEEDASHGSWQLLNKSITAHTIEPGKFHINLVFERKPLFLLINILLPIIVLALLTPVVFILPKKSGERVGYAITMLLAISVYMTIVSDNLPKNSQPMPLISIMIFIWYILDAMIVLIVIINTKIHTMPNDMPLSCCARIFVIITQKITSLVTCQSCKKSTDDGSSAEKESCIEMEAKPVNENEENQSESVKHVRSDKATWQDVSKSIDKWSFVISYLVKILLPVTFLTIAKSNSGFEE